MGRARQSVYRGNVIERCANAATPAQKGPGSPAEPDNTIIK